VCATRCIRFPCSWQTLPRAQKQLSSCFRSTKINKFAVEGGAAVAIEQDGPFGASQAPWQGKPLLPGGGTLIMVCGGVGVVPWADALRADSPDLLPYRDIVLVWAIQNKARAPAPTSSLSNQSRQSMLPPHALSRLQDEYEALSQSMKIDELDGRVKVRVSLRVAAAVH